MLGRIETFITTYPYISSMIVLGVLFGIWIVYEICTAPTMPEDFEE